MPVNVIPFSNASFALETARGRYGLTARWNLHKRTIADFPVREDALMVLRAIQSGTTEALSFLGFYPSSVDANATLTGEIYFVGVGTGFLTGAVITVNNPEALTLTFQTGTVAIWVNVSGAGLTPGVYDATYSDSEGNSITLVGALTVTGTLGITGAGGEALTGAGGEPIIGAGG